MGNRVSPLVQFFSLLHVRARLGLRLYFGSKFRVFAFLVILALFIPLALILAVTTTLWVLAGIPNVVHYLFLSIFVYVLITNLFGIFGNEFLDTSKVFLYPVSPTVVFAASVVGNLFAPVFLFFLPSLLGLLVGVWSGPLQMLLRLGFLGLFLLLAVAGSQVVSLFSVNVLNTRRFQDLVRVVAPLTGLFFYLGIQIVLRGGEGTDEAVLWMAHFPWPLKLLPSYWISTLFYDFGGGDFVTILASLGGTVFGTAILFLVGGWLQNRAFYGEIGSGGPRKAALREGEYLPRGKPSLLSHVLPDPVLAIAWKEFLIYRREPGFKTIFIQQLVIVLLVFIMQWFGPRSGGETFLFGSSALVFVVSFLLYVESSLLLNQFGPEGRGLEYLLLQPTSRESILFGKNLAAIVLFGGINTFLIFLMGVLLRVGEDMVFAWILQLGAVTMIAGFGNWTSIVLAWPMFVRGKSPAAQMRSEKLGCLRPLLSLACFLGLAITMVPLILLTIWGRNEMGAVFLFPLAGITFGYSLILYILFLQLGASVLRAREERLIALFTKSPD